MSYAGGIYTPPPSDCAPPYRLNHFMLIVGYDNVNKYWLVKNSWGLIWGQNKGVMKVREEGRQGRCYTLVADPEEGERAVMVREEDSPHSP